MVLIEDDCRYTIGLLVSGVVVEDLTSQGTRVTIRARTTLIDKPFNRTSQNISAKNLVRAASRLVKSIPPHTMVQSISRTNARSRNVRPEKEKAIEKVADASDASDVESEIGEMDEEERALNRLVMGEDEDDFMAALRGERSHEAEAEDDEDADMLDVEDEEDKDNLEDVDDAEVRLCASSFI